MEQNDKRFHWTGSNFASLNQSHNLVRAGSTAHPQLSGRVWWEPGISLTLCYSKRALAILLNVNQPNPCILLQLPLNWCLTIWLLSHQSKDWHIAQLTPSLVLLPWTQQMYQEYSQRWPARLYFICNLISAANGLLAAQRNLMYVFAGRT